MYISAKGFLLFSGTLWCFGFLTGLLYCESTFSFCDFSFNKRNKDEGLNHLMVLENREDSPVITTTTQSSLEGSDLLTPPPLPPCKPSTSNGNNDYCMIFENQTSAGLEKFSIIVPTYKRIKLLKQVLENYCALVTHVETIVVVWNNVKEAVPSELKNFQCKVALFIKTPKVNSLNNRFIHYPEIKTQAVLSADDDLLILHEDLIYQFETWKQFKHLIIGFAPRKHVEEPPDSGKFVYGGPPRDGQPDRRYSIMLTTSAMFHVQYLTLYQSQLPGHIRKFVDENMNCEDIFFNAIVAHYLHKIFGSEQCPALLVPYKDIKMIEGKNKGYKGLWSRPKHKKVRHECLNLIYNHFSGFPFGYSTFKITTA